MAETTRSASISVLAPEFDDFLFAPIGEDRNGMLLSVVSALARLDVDPWQEAAKLARLPGNAATERLAALIAALPGDPPAARDPATIAARLIALLPRRVGSEAPSPAPLLGVDIGVVPRSAIYAFLVLMAFMVCALGISASRQTPIGVHNADAPASGRVIPHLPPPSGGQ